ncbi:hypothetical protein DSECCO2_662160 [anaerobic digester metagenome]
MKIRNSVVGRCNTDGVTVFSCTGFPCGKISRIGSIIAKYRTCGVEVVVIAFKHSGRTAFVDGKTSAYIGDEIVLDIQIATVINIHRAT